MKKVNWKAWASVVLSTFAGAGLAYFALPHDGKGAKELLIGAMLAGLSAVGHLLQNPHATVRTVGEIVEEKAKADEPSEPVVKDAEPVDTQDGP